MADPKVVEWEEEKEEEANGNLMSHTNCYKLTNNPDYHNCMISVENVRKALNAAESLDNITSLTENVAVLNCKHYRSDWERVFNAVVKIRVKKADGITTGTGFLTLRPPGYNPDTERGIFSNFAVMTNFHVVRQKGGLFLLVEPQNIEVIFFYDSKDSPVVKCEVSKISGTYSPFVPGKHTDEKLDFAMLYIKHPVSDEKMKRLKALKPLLFEESGRVQAVEVRQIADKKRLCVIGHPHGAYKQIAFGELTTNTNGLYQEWKEACKEDFHSVEHSVATCGGSSGSPVILIGLKDGQPQHLIYSVLYVSFLHFRGDSQYGEAASMQSILPCIRKGLQGLQDERV